MLIDRRYFRYFDWLSFSLTILIASIGLLFVFSATYAQARPYSLFFKKQLFGITTGIIIYLVFCLLDYRSLARWGYFIYFAVLGLLAFTILKGSVGMGAQRWINLGIIKFQPSELAKLFLPAFLSYYFMTQKDHTDYTFTDYIPALCTIAVSFILVLKQPDLGTALLILFSAAIMLWFAGLSKKFFIYLLLFGALTSPLSWRLLKPYQKQRIFVFLGYGQTHKERYQIEQSQIAIGSGGIRGKGLLRGTQNVLNFLPESRTDFIFAVLAEEWGFIGTLLLLLLYLMLFMRQLYICCTLEDFYTQLLGVGLIIHIVLSTIINIGMVTGLLPIVGIPLPLMSYGISHLWITFASLGWFNSIAIRRFYTGIGS